MKPTRPLTPARPFTKTHLQKINDKLDALGQYHRELVEDLPFYDEFVAERLMRRGIEKKEYANIEENHEDVVDFIKEMEEFLRREQKEQKVKRKLEMFK